MCKKYRHICSFPSRVIFGSVRRVCSTYLAQAYNMDQRSAIKFCVRLQKSFTETYSMIQRVFDDEVKSNTITYRDVFRNFAPQVI